MKMIKSLRLRHIAALLLLGSCSAFAAGQLPASAEASDGVDEVGGSLKQTATLFEINGATPDQACHFAMCKEHVFDEPKIETVLGSDVLPGFGSPALSDTGQDDDRC